MAKKKPPVEKETKSRGSRPTSGLRSLFAETDVTWETRRLPTGIVPLDYVLGGGFGFGRLGEIYGGHASTKTYILYRALIACQKMGGTSVLIESEGGYDPAWFDKLGGSSKELLVKPVKTTQEVFMLMQEIAKFADDKKDHNICIGWDGIAATATEHLMEEGLDKTDMSKPKVMSQGCEYITTAIKEKSICVIATNQIRDSMDKYKGPVTPGGRAWPFHASQRIEMKFDGGKVNNMILDPIPPVRKDDDEQIIGRRVTAFIEKNKLGPGCRTVELPFYLYEGRKHPIYGTPTVLGFDAVEALFDFYHHGPFQLPNTDPTKQPWEGPRVIESGASGWYSLAAEIDPEQKGFHKADWPEVLAKFPRLNTLPFEGGDGA